MGGLQPGRVQRSSAVSIRHSRHICNGTTELLEVCVPIAFADMEIRAEDPSAPTVVTHLPTGINVEGLSAMQTSGPEMAKPIDGLMEGAKTRPGTIVSDVSRAQTGDMETLSFALSEPKGASFFAADSNPCLLI
jgi:hypothetical protein